MKILVADDDAVPRRLLEAILVKWEYDVVIAGDGEEAWRILQEDDTPHLAILDWLMPGLDGPEICRRVRQRRLSPYIYILLLTSKDRKEDVVEGMNAGADDYLIKPFNRHELQVRLRAGRRIVDLQAALLNSIDEVRTAEEGLAQARRREAETGAKIQQTLLLGQPPRDLLGGRVAALTVPSQHIDGDFLDFFPHKDHCLDIVVGDVMGKGVPAALLGAAIKSELLRALGRLGFSSGGNYLPDPEEIVASLHAEVTHQFIGLERFATLVYGRFELEKSRLIFVDCGHTKTICFRRSTGKCELLTQGQNMPLGFSAEEVYRQVSVNFAAGDLFFFYSDGITEAQNLAGELFGMERLIGLVEKYGRRDPAELIDIVRQAVVAFSDRDTFADDLTCVAVQIAEGDGQQVLTQASRRVPGSLTELEPLRALVHRFCLEDVPPPILDDERLYRLELAVTEAASNIIKHGLEGLPERSFRFELEAFSDRIRIRFSHTGSSFDPAGVQPPTFDGSREGGFGVYMIAQCVDAVHYWHDDDGTNWIEMTVNRRR